MQGADRPTPDAMPRRSRAHPPDGGTTRTIECLSCGAVTVHVKGRVTSDDRGEVLVQWWDCTVCEEGEAV